MTVGSVGGSGVGASDDGGSDASGGTTASDATSIEVVVDSPTPVVVVSEIVVFGRHRRSTAH